MNVTLVMIKGDGRAREFPIKKNKVLIGRTHTCDLRIPLPSVSRQHCEITVEDEQVKMRDLGSSNGTFHNDNRVQEATLEPGDHLNVGTVSFLVVIDGQPPLPDSDATGAIAEALSDSQAPAASTPAPPPSPAKPRSATPAPMERPKAGKPQMLPAHDGELPPRVDVESHSVTVDLDDPIAALEAMAASEDVEIDDLPISLDDDDDDSPLK